MKYFYIICFTLLNFFTYAQDNAISENQFLEIEMNKIQKHLHTPELQLQNEQVSKIRNLLTQKYTKVYQSWNTGLSKEEMSQRRTEIENEYAPQVEAVLTSQQRLALLKSKTAHSK